MYRQVLKPSTRLGGIAFVVLMLACAGCNAEVSETVLRLEHTRMVAAIRDDAELTKHYTGREKLDDRVLDAMARVPRHEYVETWLPGAAYENVPLPIGHGQTISQPFIVALMTDLVEPDPEHVVLEIGTGSGYQAAVLAELVHHVYTIEIIGPLAETASARLARLGYDNVTVRHGDGYYGWPEHAPFHGIVVTAVAESIPPPLLEQLAPGGRMIIPVGNPRGAQNLVLVTKDSDGTVTTREVLPVAFVPFTRDP